MSVANHGTSWAAFKPGSKRRRTKAEIFEQDTAEQLRAKEAEENAQRIAELEALLAEKETQVQNNESATRILTELIDKGDCELQGDGSVSVSKKKHQPNVIGNLPD